MTKKKECHFPVLSLGNEAKVVSTFTCIKCQQKQGERDDRETGGTVHGTS